MLHLKQNLKGGTKIITTSVSTNMSSSMYLGGGAWSDPDPGVITPSTIGTVQGSKDLTVCCGSHSTYQLL